MDDWNFKVTVCELLARVADAIETHNRLWTESLQSAQRWQEQAARQKEETR